MDLPSSREVALRVLRDEVYGGLPLFDTASVRVFEDGLRSDGVRVRLLEISAAECTSQILLALPEGLGPVPVFVGLNFKGNDNLDAWPLKQITGAGFALAISCYQDWYADDASNVRTPRAISTWAAALIQMRQAVVSQPEIDSSKTVAIGHSRLAKAALWAAANDPDFAACVAIQSGCGGAGPNQTIPGEEGAERIGDIVSMFPHWFADKYDTWANRESEMPFDQQWLLAAIAPRPILLLNAEEDRWANPAGQDRMAEAARTAFPRPDLVQTHTRPGGHEVLTEDWDRTIAFADALFR